MAERSDRIRISVIIKSNRTDADTDISFWKDKQHLDVIDEDIRDVWAESFSGISSYLEPTLKSLSQSIFRDFELVLVHRHPETVLETVKKYGKQLKIKLVSEKKSIWHDLGSDYCTISNAINTGIIWADGELLVSADDCSIWDSALLAEIWDLWQRGEYAIPKAVKYVLNSQNAETDRWHKRTKLRYGVIREETLYQLKPGDVWLPTYGYCFSVSLKDALLLNGFDESLDGAMHGEDGDFGERLSLITDAIRRITAAKIYFFGHSYKNVKDYRLVRDNRKFKEFLRQRPFPPERVRANVWRPSKAVCEMYKRWHLETYGDIDENFDKCREVETFLLKNLRRLRKAGKVSDKTGRLYYSSI